MEDDTQDLALHKLSTIGLVQSFGEKREFFFYRRDMSPESLRHLVEEFVDQLEKSQVEMQKLLPESVTLGYKKYRELANTPEFKKKLPEFKSKVYDKLAYLRQMLFLPTYSWNGQKYDVSVMLGSLMETFARDKKKFEKMRVIKRGTSYMEIKYGLIVIRDFMNFSSPMSLGEFVIFILTYYCASI